DPVCSNKISTYSVTAISGADYDWSVTGGTIMGSNLNNTVNVRWGAAGTGSLTVTQTSAAGCDSTISRTITINPTPAPVISGPDPVCSNKIYSYSITSIAGSTYNWSVTGGAIMGSNSSNSVSIRWGTSGSGTLTV